MSILKNNKGLYVVKDPDGYFLRIKGTSICKKITKYEFLDYKRYLEEWGSKNKKSGSDE